MNDLIFSGMFDTNHSGQIDLNEFQALWNYIHQWRGVFDGFDRDRSGHIDANELNNGQLELRHTRTRNHRDSAFVFDLFVMSY